MDEVSGYLKKTMDVLGSSMENINKMVKDVANLQPKEKKVIFAGRCSMSLMPNGTIIMEFTDPKEGEKHYREAK